MTIIDMIIPCKTLQWVGVGCSWSCCCWTKLFTHSLVHVVCNLHCPNDNLHSWYKCKWHIWNIYYLFSTSNADRVKLVYFFIDRPPYEILYSLYMWNCLFLPSLNALSTWWEGTIVETGLSLKWSGWLRHQQRLMDVCKGTGSQSR